MIMNMFSKLEGEVVILRSKGTWTQNDVYILGDRVFAKRGSGYIALRADHNGQTGSTTVPDIHWLDITIKYKKGEHQYMLLE